MLEKGLELFHYKSIMTFYVLVLYHMQVVPFLFFSPLPLRVHHCCQLIMIYLVYTAAGFEGSSTWNEKQYTIAEHCLKHGAKSASIPCISKVKKCHWTEKYLENFLSSLLPLVFNGSFHNRVIFPFLIFRSIGTLEEWKAYFLPNRDKA